MAQYMKPPIVLLRNGTDASQGTPQILSNITACMSVVEIVQSTMGPRGMDKLFEGKPGQESLVSNDGATVMQQLNIAHPAAKMLLDIARAQDLEIGDGTTSVVVLCGEILRVAGKPFLEEGMAPAVIVEAIQMAKKQMIEKIHSLAKETGGNDSLRRVAETTLNSKLVADQKQFFSKMVVDAVIATGEDLALKAVGIKKITGGSVTDSRLINGVAFKKTFSYAGHLWSPKRIATPKVLLLHVELEHKAEKDNAEIRVSPDQYQNMVDAEWSIIVDKLRAIKDVGANVVLSTLAIGDLATQFFADNGIFCAGRVEPGDMERTRRALGGHVQTTVNGITPAVLGACGSFEEVEIGSERWSLFHDGSEARTATLIIRGGAKQFVDEAERSLHDSIMIVRRAVQNRKVVGGGGAIEMELSRFLKQYSLSIHSKHQRVVEAVARALEVIPKTLAKNAGYNVMDSLTELRKAHTEPGGRWMGVNCCEGGIVDTMETHVWEPSVVKENALLSACEAACIVLSIDETVKNPQSEQPGKGMGKGAKGAGKGFSQSMMHMAGGGKGMGMRQMRR